MVGSLVQTVSQLIYPAFCYHCYKLVPKEQAFCPPCFTDIKPVVSLIVPVTAKKHIKIFAAGAYQEPLRQLVIRKFRRDLLASRHLAKLLITFVPQVVFDNTDLIIPIPLHWTRYARRGFNQAVEIARELKQQLHLPVSCALKRNRMTSFQFHLSKLERKENLQSAFMVKNRFKSEISGKKILLVDDLFTTGATVISAAREIYKAGAQEVTVLVGCRKI